MPRLRPAIPPGAEIPLPATAPLFLCCSPVAVGDGAAAPGLGARAGRGARDGAGAVPAGVRSGRDGCMLGGFGEPPPLDELPIPPGEDELRDVICARERESRWSQERRVRLREKLEMTPGERLETHGRHFRSEARWHLERSTSWPSYALPQCIGRASPADGWRFPRCGPRPNGSGCRRAGTERWRWPGRGMGSVHR